MAAGKKRRKAKRVKPVPFIRVTGATGKAFVDKFFENVRHWEDWAISVRDLRKTGVKAKKYET